MDIKKNIIKVLCVLSVCTMGYGQHHIKAFFKGNRVPGNVALYRMQNTVEVYVMVGSKKQDYFDFQLDANAPKGMYRIVYQVNPRLTADFIVDEPVITFDFNADHQNELIFKESKENKLYRSFLKEYRLKQMKLTQLLRDFYKEDSDKDKIQATYKQLLVELDQIYQQYLKQSKGMLVAHFIKANKVGNAPTLSDKASEYFDYVRDHYFDEVDFKNPYLANSDFYMRRVYEFIFDLHNHQHLGLVQAYKKKGAKIVFDKDMPITLKGNLLKTMIGVAVQNKDDELAQFLFNDYYKKLPPTQKQPLFEKFYKKNLKMAIGNKAPDITWQQGKQSYQLSTLQGGEQYLLIFWSSDCPHCQKAVPKAYQYLKAYPKVKVITIGFENKDTKKQWKKTIKKLKGWYHIFMDDDLEDSDLQKMIEPYNITSTPTFFLLDKAKNIVSVPSSLEGIKPLLKK